MALTRSRFRLGVTPVGLAVIAAALALLVRSLMARNAYEIVASAVVTLLWAALFATGKWGARRLAAMEPNWKPPSPLTANTQEETLFTGLGCAVPWFFRLHVTLEGRFHPSGSAKGCRVFLEAAVPNRAAQAAINLSLPMSGLFKGEGSCRLKDIFGFLSFRCGLPQQRSVNVMGEPIARKRYRVDPQSGAEDRRSKTSDDEERYYMREYAPGDRFRDINWKSSERIDTLITRISPDTHEKTRRIEVHFRNYGPAEASLDALWLLDRAKARLAQFLRVLKEADDRYVFTIRTAHGTGSLETMEDIERFLDLLVVLPFVPPWHEDPGEDEEERQAPPQSDLFVFTTACDKGVRALIAACSPRPVTVFIVVSAMPWDRERLAQERGHGAETRGHGAEARGHGAEARGHGAEAPGHGAEARGHGAEAAGHGAEAAGHGAEARGHGAEARGHGAEAPGRIPEVPTLAVADFVRAGCVPLPGWLFRREKWRLTVSSDHLEMDYADTCLWRK